MSRSFYKGLLGTVPSGKKLFKVLLRAGVSIAIIAALLWWLPTDKLVGAIKTVPALVWFAVFLAFIFGHIVSALKWRLLLHAVKVNTGKLEVVRAHGAGLFANLCLPSVVGGDLVRATVIIRQHGKLEAVTLGSLADRLNDTIALVMIAAIAGMLVPASSDIDAARIIGFVALLLLTGVIAGVIFIRYVPLDLLPNVLKKSVSKFQIALTALFAVPHISLMAFMLSVLIQSGFIGLNIWLADAMGITATAYVWFFVWPLAKLVALVPISLGGIGVREAALSVLLLPFGIEAALSVAQGLSWQAVLIFSGLFAGLIVTFIPAGMTMRATTNSANTQT